MKTSICLLSLFVSTQAALAINPFSGVTANELATGLSGFSGSLAKGGDVLYFSTNNTIQELDTANGNNISTRLTATGFVDAAALIVRPSDGELYGALTDTFISPFPYEFGLLPSSGFVSRYLQDGIFDAEVAPNGDLFLVANPFANGSEIFQVNWDTGMATSIASPGGFSGGIAFDADGNLYYATNSSVLRYTVASNYTVSDTYISGLTNANQLAFDDDGSLFVSTGFGQNIELYDPTGQFEAVAVRGADSTAFGNLIYDNGALYAVYADFNIFERTIYEFTGLEEIPEPSATPLLLGVIACLMARRRKAS